MKITLDNQNYTLTESMTVSRFLAMQRVFHDSPCGGKGTCGKCRIHAFGDLSAPSKNERTFLTDAELASGLRLACEAVLLGDCRLSLSAKSSQKIEVTGTGGFAFVPSVMCQQLNSPVPDLGNQMSDDKRLPGGHAVPLSVLKKLPALLRESNFTPYCVTYNNQVLDVTAAKPDLTGVAIDIGTTTVVAYFYDMESGELADTQSALNSQRAFGADVISRIEHCRTTDGLISLQKAIADTLNALIHQFSEASGRSVQSIYRFTVAANTTMLHLLCGLTPDAIAASPFIPASGFGFDLSAADIGLDGNPNAQVTLLPCISAYVGADITAGIAASNLTDNTLFIDVGTNGEMGLLSRGQLITCSVAAGPAFEGAHIKHGTGGVPGAVCSVAYEDGDFALQTIDNLPVQGLCGSGLIDAMAALLEAGVIDMTGRLADADELPDALQNRLGEDEFFLCDGLSLTAQDIREVQLAKSAVCAGIHTLLSEAGLSLDDVARVVVAGGFGAHINPVSACRIGLFPKELLGHIDIVGNASGMGACKALLENNLPLFAEIAQSARHLELSGRQDFMDMYIEQMMFE